MPGNDWRLRPLAQNRRPFRDLIMTPSLTHGFALLSKVDEREPGSLTFVVGPGGAAKTSLCEALPTSLYGAKDLWPIDCIPMISVSARTPDRGYFSWGALITSLLQQLLDPFHCLEVEDPRIDSRLHLDLCRAMSRITRVRCSAVEMWEIFISLARQVGLRHIVIDEANLLTITQQNRLPSDYIEALRSAALVIECTIILFGTYELLEVIDFSAQNNRRNLNIQLERLRFGTVEETTLFLSVAEAVAEECGVPKDLVSSDPQWFYDASYGIVGELVELFRRARIHASADGATKVESQHLKRASHLPQALTRMRFEADEIDRAFSRTYAKPRPKKAPETRATRQRGRRKAKRLSLGAAE